MAVLKNARHEAFAQALAKGKSAVDAYVEAGYKPNRSHASRLVANGNIADRVTELQKKVAKKVEVTVESLAGELEQARKIAIGEKQTSAAVQATMGKAKLFGLGSEHRRISGSLQLMTLTPDMIRSLNSDERELLAAAIPVLAKLGFLAEDADGGGDSRG